MHETVIANQIIEKARAAGKVRRIVLAVGELAHLTLEELRAALTSLVHWEITMIDVPAKVKCICGYRGSPEILERGHDLCLFHCPVCGEVPKVLSGGDIILKEVEVED